MSRVKGINKPPRDRLKQRAVTTPRPQKASNRVLLPEPRELKPWRRVPSWSCGCGRHGPCQGWKGTEGRNREGILSTLILQSLLRSLICPNSSGARGTGTHQVAILRGSLLLTFLEKFSFSDKSVQVWMAFPLTPPFLPCWNEGMMAKGHHQLS